MAYIDDIGNHYNDGATELIQVSRKIKYLSVPSSVRVIQKFAFLNCSLRVIIFNSRVDFIQGLYGFRVSQIYVPIGETDYFVALFNNNEKIREIIKEIDFKKVGLYYNIGISMLEGNEVTKDIPKALEYLEYCAKNLDVRAIYRLAQYYENQHLYIRAYNRYLIASYFFYKDAIYKIKILENLAKQEQKCNEEEKARKQREIEHQRQLEKERSIHNNILFFDTETTGLPLDNNADVSNIANWPRIVQLAWIVSDEQGNVIKNRNCIIYPDGFDIPRDASNIHHITTERARINGVSLRSVLEEFITDLNEAARIVGHNIGFDKNVVGAELCRLGLDYNVVMRKPSTCTMLSTIGFCKLTPLKKGEYKWPKLSELYFKLFGQTFDDAHDASSDINATKKCYFELKHRSLL